MPSNFRPPENLAGEHKVNGLRAVRKHCVMLRNAAENASSTASRNWKSSYDDLDNGHALACDEWIMSAADIPRTTLDHLLEGFQVIGADWTYLYVNPAAARHGRSTREQLEGRKMWEAYPGIEQMPVFVLLKRVMDERVAASTEYQFQFPDGTSRWFELRIEPVPEGICVHSIDIEDRRRAEGALREFYDKLERRVAERTRELERANRDLEAFSYTVSHDLRAPLRAIGGFSELLAERSGDLLDDEGRRYLDRIRAAADRMGVLIDEFLRLGRIGHAPLERADVDLSALARTVADEIQKREPERRVAWVIEPELHARCDPGLARVVFDNLLGNAWKFTSRTDGARIEVRGDKNQAFVVVDNGAGFDMKHAHALFRPFSRLHKANEFPGSGIGLATVQRIVEKHGGSVRAEGSIGRGTVVTVRFGPEEADA